MWGLWPLVCPPFHGARTEAPAHLAPKPPCSGDPLPGWCPNRVPLRVPAHGQDQSPCPRLGVQSGRAAPSASGLPPNCPRPWGRGGPGSWELGPGGGLCGTLRGSGLPAAVFLDPGPEGLWDQLGRARPPPARGVGAPKVWGSQAERREKSSSRPGCWTRLLPTVPGGAEGEGLSSEGEGAGSLGDQGRAGRGRKGLAHPTGMAPSVPGAQWAAARPPTPPTAWEASTSLPSPAPLPLGVPVVWPRPREPSPAVREVPGSRALRPRPRGPLKDCLRPDPTTGASSHPARSGSTDRPSSVRAQEGPLTSTRPVHTAQSRARGEGSCGVPSGAAPPSPRLWPPASLLSHLESGKLPGPGRAG